MCSSQWTSLGLTVSIRVALVSLCFCVKSKTGAGVFIVCRQFSVLGRSPLVQLKGTLSVSVHKDVLDNFMQPTLRGTAWGDANMAAPVYHWIGLHIAPFGFKFIWQQILIVSFRLQRPRQPWLLNWLYTLTHIHGHLYPSEQVGRQCVVLPKKTVERSCNQTHIPSPMIIFIIKVSISKSADRCRSIIN